jgi:hypothetical protein
MACPLVSTGVPQLPCLETGHDQQGGGGERGECEARGLQCVGLRDLHGGSWVSLGGCPSLGEAAAPALALDQAPGQARHAGVDPAQGFPGGGAAASSPHTPDPP